MNCSHCSDKIEKALKQDPDNQGVKANLENGTVEIERNSEADLDKLNELLEPFGFYHLSK